MQPACAPSDWLPRHYACHRCGGSGRRWRQQKRKRRKVAVALEPVTVTHTENQSQAQAVSPAAAVVFEACFACHGCGLLPAEAFELSDAAAASCPRPRPLPPRVIADGPLVLIAGCGISGAALALALQHRGMRTLVAERDTSGAARSQGYGLTIQQGGAALSAIGVTVTGVTSVQHMSYDAAGRLLGCYGQALRDSKTYRTAASTRANFHLPRQRLRTAILNQLQPDSVRWGVSVERYAECEDPSDSTADPGVTVFLSDGSSVRCSLLVGADGIRSRIRDAKLGDRLKYLGLAVVLGYTRTCCLTLRRRVTQTSDGHTRIYTMPFAGKHSDDGENEAAGDTNTDCDSDTTMWQLSFPLDEASALALHTAGSTALKAEALRRCAAWHAPIPALLEATPGECITGYPVYDRDLPEPELFRCGMGRSSGRASRVTLIGDAAHPMSPFKGQGANQALLDAVALARALVTCDWRNNADSEASLPSALAAFELSMLARVRIKVLESRANATFLHSSAALTEGNCSRAAVAKASGQAAQQN